MKKWIFGLLLSVNVIFFAVMYWGAALTVDTKNPPVQAAINADKLKLMSMSVASAPVSVVSVPPMVVAVTPSSHVEVAPVASAKMSCMEWGEFSGSNLERAGKALGEIKLGDKLNQREVEYSGGYWVFMAPLKNHAQVELKISQLKALGVEDYFVIQEAGSWQNAISLGVFKTRDAAIKYLDKLKEQGVRTAKVGERKRKLKFTVFMLSHLEEGVSSRITALHNDFPGSELKLIPCN